MEGIIHPGEAAAEAAGQKTERGKDQWTPSDEQKLIRQSQHGHIAMVEIINQHIATNSSCPWKRKEEEGGRGVGVGAGWVEVGIGASAGPGSLTQMKRTSCASQQWIHHTNLKTN